jgi:signal transduction histidine kinase
MLLNEVGESITKVEAASDVIRRVAHMLHPSRLEQGGLVETLRWYVNAISGPRLRIAAELPDRPIRISKEGEIVLFRLLQECLNHIVGRAHKATVRLSGDPEVLLQVTIDGPLPLGLHDALTSERADLGGFSGARERLRQLGGTLKVMAGAKKSVVEVSLPVE